jgi:hypothetical protein
MSEVEPSLASSCGPGKELGPPATSPEAQALRAVEGARLRARVDANMAVVEALHADDFQVWEQATAIGGIPEPS